MKTPKFILAGYERGGTTLLSEIFRANGYESGFECGVLMVDSPHKMAKLQPYWNMLLDGWRISKDVRKRAASGDFAHFYDTIINAAFPNFEGNFFDKTPVYMSRLGQCLQRGPGLQGAVVIHRDPRAAFLSWAKRLSPGVSGSEAILGNFDALVGRYLTYFYGSVSYLDQPNVLFVPFEELVSRESSWLKNIGNFVKGDSFVKRAGKPRYVNVTSSKMDLGKVMEFDEVLPKELQERILVATKIASIFFADAVDRAKFGQYWQDAKGEADSIIEKYDLPLSVDFEDGTYFEPLPYLLRYEDVRRARVNPVEHFRRHGRKERRVPL